MKSIFLSVVVISALAIAGIGGTLANFSDTEMVIDNTFETGSLDLLVWDGSAWVDQEPWGTGASGVVSVVCAAPEEEYWTKVWVANFGDCVGGVLYMHFKNCTCYNVDPSHEESGYWKYDDGLNGRPFWRLKPEPELVAEYGGWVDQVWVEWGVTGDNCSMTSNVEVSVWFDNTMMQDWTLLCDVDEYFYLGELPSCGEQHIVWIGLRYHDIEDPNWTCPGNPMFADWPTNRLMLDGLKFDFIFGLVQPVAQ